MAHHRQARRAGNITPIFLPSRAPELKPVENVWQYLRQNWLSNRVFENYDAIIDAACEAWRKLTAAAVDLSLSDKAVETAPPWWRSIHSPHP
jgi:transposase